jgi:uncharacterized protein
VTSPVLIVRGEAQLDVPPDRASVSVTVHSTGSSAAAVRRELAAASEQVRPLLEAAPGVLEFRSTGLHVGPLLAGRGGARITGYRGSFGTTIEVDDLEHLPALVQSLLGLPQAQVDGPWWSLRRDHPAYREARLAAVGDAQRRAEDYAAAFGATVGAVLEVSDLEEGFAARPFGKAMRAMAAPDEPAFDFEPELQTVTGRITVRFAMTT